MPLLLLIFSLMFSMPNWAGDKVIIAYGHNYKPFAWVENGQLKGMHIDILNELFQKRLGLQVEHQRYPWKRAQWQLQTGKADIIVTAYTANRAQYSVASQEALVNIQYKLYTYKDHPRLSHIASLTSLTNLQGLTAVEYLGSTTEDLTAAGIKIHLVPEIDSALKFLANRRADIFFDTPISTTSLIKKLGLQQQIVEMPNIIAETHHQLLISKQSSLRTQLPLINQTIRAMKQDGTLANIQRQYY